MIIVTIFNRQEFTSSFGKDIEISQTDIMLINLDVTKVLEAETNYPKRWISFKKRQNKHWPIRVATRRYFC